MRDTSDDDKTDPVIATVGIRDVATFELAIPRHSYHEMMLILDTMKSKFTQLIVDVLDATLTYSPDYMHGLPKKLYIRCLERMIEAEKCKQERHNAPQCIISSTGRLTP